jgi:hypothetical protein
MTLVFKYKFRIEPKIGDVVIAIESFENYYKEGAIGQIVAMRGKDIVSVKFRSGDFYPCTNMTWEGYIRHFRRYRNGADIQK